MLSFFSFREQLSRIVSKSCIVVHAHQMFEQACPKILTGYTNFARVPTLVGMGVFLGVYAS